MNNLLCAPEASGVRSSDISEFIKRINNAGLYEEMHGFIIMRHGKTLAEGYFGPYQKDMPHMMCSVTKAFTSAAVGLASDEGLLKVSDKILKYFPEYQTDDPQVANMTLWELLTMTTGKAPTPLHNSSKDNTDDRIKAFFELPFEAMPGTKFIYSSYSSYMLSAIVQRVTGKTAVDYVYEKLLRELGFNYPIHTKSPQGICEGYSGMRITLREFADFGQFFLQKGFWNGRQLLSREWIEEATKKHIDTSSVNGPDWSRGYAYHFWRGTKNTFRFCGANGQMCVVMPEQDMVFACVSAYSGTSLQYVLDSFYDTVLSNVSSYAFPENESAYLDLQDNINNLHLPEVDKICDIDKKLYYESDFIKSACINENNIEIDFGKALRIPFGIAEVPDVINFCHMDKKDKGIYYTGCRKKDNKLVIESRLINTMTIILFEFDFKEKSLFCKTIRGTLDKGVKVYEKDIL